MYTRNLTSLLIVAALAIASGLSGSARAQATSSATEPPPPQPTDRAEPITFSATATVPRASTGASVSAGRSRRGGRAAGTGEMYGYGTTIVQSNLLKAPSGNSVLLVPSAQPQQERLLSWNEDLTVMCRIEDLTVMCRIFDRLLSEAGLKGQERVGYGFMMSGGDDWIGSFFSNADGSTECLYIEGYGPLFLMSVEFPLVAPPREDSQADANEPADPLWEQVRQEAYAPQTRRGSREGGGRSPYSAEKVKLLKETLLRALQHAANIRGLDEDTWLTVTVRGPGMAADGTHAWMGPGLRPYGLYDEMMDPAKPLPTVILTIRARIEDISGVASGQLASDEFAGRVEITEP